MANESIEDLLGATITGGTGISVSYADNGANTGVVTISTSVGGLVATEQETQEGQNNTKIVTPQRLEESQPSDHGETSWTGYTYESGTVDVAGEIKKHSNNEWEVINTSGHSNLYDHIRMGTHARVEHDASTYEEGTIAWAKDDGTSRIFKFETAGFSSAGSFSDGDSVSLTTEGKFQKAISDRTDIARTDVAETFSRAVTISSGGLTLTSGDLDVSSGNVTIGGNLTVSGSTTTMNTEEINLADNIIKLNSNASGTPVSTQDAGIEIERGSAANKSLYWDESEDKWTVGSEAFAAGKLEGDGSGITGLVAAS